METAFYILAESEPTAKIIFAVVAGIIWLVSAIAGQIQKKKQAEHREVVREEIDRIEQAERLRGMAGSTPPSKETDFSFRDAGARAPESRQPARVPLPQQPLPVPQPTRRPIPPKLAPSRTQAPPARPSPARSTTSKRRTTTRERSTTLAEKIAKISPVEELPERVTRAPVTSTDIPTVTARTHPAINARALAQWLQPHTLRQQFILTELFQPPVSMRDKHLGS